MSKHILIIDDSITTREFVTSILEDAGYKTSSAKDGAEGLQLILNGNYDLIITDLLMPEMTGLELLEKLAEHSIETPTIVLTADIQNEAKEECFELGANSFINKPIFDPEVLINPVKKLIN